VFSIVRSRPRPRLLTEARSLTYRCWSPRHACTWPAAGLRRSINHFADRSHSEYTVTSWRSTVTQAPARRSPPIRYRFPTRNCHAGRGVRYLPQGAGVAVLRRACGSTAAISDSAPMAKRAGQARACRRLEKQPGRSTGDVGCSPAAIPTSSRAAAAGRRFVAMPVEGSSPAWPDPIRCMAPRHEKGDGAGTDSSHGFRARLAGRPHRGQIQHDWARVPPTRPLPPTGAFYCLLSPSTPVDSTRSAAIAIVAIPWPR